jgi:hypothetical protein
MVVATLNCPRDKQAPSVFLDIREKRFKWAADAQQIGVGKFGMDVAGDKHSIETQCIRSGIDREFMDVTES